jgi:hypothetical protein
MEIFLILEEVVHVVARILQNFKWNTVLEASYRKASVMTTV